jgi:hypothetical protein
MSYANDATNRIRAQAAREAQAVLLQERFWRDTGARIGYTGAPELKRQIHSLDDSSTALDKDIKKNVVDADFKRAWISWLATFRTYRDRWYSWTQEIALESWDNSEVEAANRQYQQELEDWYNKYRAQTALGGQPVPSPTAPDPAAPTPKPGAKGKGDDSGPSLSLPWWAWMLGGIGVVGAAYGGYRWYQKTQETQRAMMPLAMKMAAMDAMRDLAPMSPSAVPQPVTIVG